ncbi:MAG: WD40/YVTN/BNR-like repeat-containing protein, partial [Gemmatimonadaceae bacterium]
AHTGAQRVFLIGNFGLYRSDDGGGSWRQMDSADHRIANGQGGYNCGVYVDPENPDIVYTINTSSYVSADGGNTFTGFKGAPGGDDPQQMWIDPTNGKRILLGLDQGATVTLDGGQTWSLWYNQSTEQVYHISTDASFPFWIYATQQDAGAVRTRNRGNMGAITPLDWSPVPSWEWGTIVPDPLHPDTVYASGNGLVKITYPSEQWINVSPAQDPALRLRTASTQPLVWAPWNQHELFSGFQYLMATTDGGAHWAKLGGDLGVPHGSEPSAPAPPSRGGPAGPPNGGIIETIAPSTVAAGTIWVGTNNGLIRVTRDNGKTWSDVSIAGLPNAARADIVTIDASHTNGAAAYVAIDEHNLGDYMPYLYRTRDYGKTWTKIVTGLPVDEPSGSFAHVIRNDPKRAGLLFAGTESGMYVSFDDGEHWQSLQLNLPNTSYRDITFHGSDLIVGTYGRGIWVLDDYTVLRQLTPEVVTASVHLFKPDDAVRVRRNDGADTPFPPEVPHMPNPPDGLLIYYTLAAPPRGDITLDVIDASGTVVRHLSSAPIKPLAEAAAPPEPNFWLATPQPMPAAVGLNRVNWDLRWDPPPAFGHTYEINANAGLTPASPEGPMALPGVYTLKLTANGTTYTQTATVRNDPRSPATAVALRAQNALLMRLYHGLTEAWSGYHALAGLRAEADKAAAASAPADVAQAIKTFDEEVDSVTGNPEGGRGFRFGRGPAPAPDYVRVNGTLVQQIEAQDNGDMAPTVSSLAGTDSVCKELATVDAAARRLTTTRLTALDAVLGRHSLG